MSSRCGWATVRRGRRDGERVLEASGRAWSTRASSTVAITVTLDTRPEHWA